MKRMSNVTLCPTSTASPTNAWKTRSLDAGPVPDLIVRDPVNERRRLRDASPRVHELVETLADDDAPVDDLHAGQGDDLVASARGQARGLGVEHDEEGTVEREQLPAADIHDLVGGGSVDEDRPCRHSRRLERALAGSGRHGKGKGGEARRLVRPAPDIAPETLEHLAHGVRAEGFGRDGHPPLDLGLGDHGALPAKVEIHTLVAKEGLQLDTVGHVEIGKYLEAVRAQAEAGQRHAHALDGGAQQALPAPEHVGLPADVLAGENKRPGRPRQVREQPDAAAEDAALQSCAHERDAAVRLARLLMSHPPLPQDQEGIFDGSRGNQQVQRTADPQGRVVVEHDARLVVADEEAFLEGARIVSRRT